MHRIAADGRRVLTLDARYTGWAERERLEVAAGEGVGASPGFITPREGDEFLVEAGIPLSSQTIPVRVRAAEGARLVVDGRVVALEGGRLVRVPLLAGTHALELRNPGSAKALQIVHVRLRGPSAAESAR
jgi:hypothetical protein